MATGGTPIMLASPRSALDLPLRALIREEADGAAIVSFRPITGALAALAQRLGAAQDLLLKAIQS